MATTEERRVVIVDVKGSDSAVAHMKALQKAAANTDKNIGRMQKTMNSMGNTIKAFIAYRLTAYIAQIGPAFIELADSVSLMEARLDLTNNGMKTTTELMNDLFDVSERSRTSIDATATLYGRLAAATESLGTSQETLLDFTELVADTFLLSGSSAAEAASGVTQLSQAMAKGTLDGDEFKSIMENNVYFAKLLAQSLGVTRGELAEMSKTGQLTTETLLKMSDSVDEVRSQVEDMPYTFDQMATAWGNAFAKMVSDADSFTGYLEQRFRALTTLANNVADFFDDSDEAQLSSLNEELNNLIDKRIRLEQQQNNSNSFLDGLLNTKDKIGNQLAVLATDIDKVAQSIFELEEAARIDAFVNPTPAIAPPQLGGATEAAKKKPSRTTRTPETVGSILKKFNEEQAKANQFIDQAADLFSRGKINLEEYLHIYERFIEASGVQINEAGGFVDAQEEVNAVLEASKTPIEDYIDQQNRLSEIAAQYPELADQVIEAQTRIAEGFDESNGLESMEEAFINWADIAKSAVDGVADSFIDLALEGKLSFQEFADSFIKDITRMIIKQQLLNALQSLTSGTGLEGLFGGASAKGNVFDSGAIVPFANGGVVNAPTVFPMANGMGLMGEAGSEAILPLKRDKNGDLGVSSEQNNSVAITINVMGGSNSPEEIRRSASQVAQAAYNATNRANRRNG